MLSAQTLSLGREAGRVQAACERLAKEQVTERLWRKDAGLWTRDADAQAAIRQRLGWLTIPRVMARQTASLRTFANALLTSGFTHTFVLGMGGSSLFAEVCRNTFGVADGHADLTVLDTTDPTAIRSREQSCPPRQLAVIVSSKSGTTTESTALAKYFYETFKRGDIRAGDHCVAVTDAGTPLATQAENLGFRQIFAHGPEDGLDVGGRFSALTYFGLAPAALLGVDLDMLLARAIAMLDACRSDEGEPHPAAELAAALGTLGTSGVDKVTLLASPALASFGTWVEQLVAESIGKSGKGLNPIFGEPTQAPGQYGKDRVFIELQLASQPDAGLEGQVRAIEDAGFPVIRIRWHDRYDLGAEVVKWELAVALIGYLMELNPFDEPNVQESKDLTTALLSSHARDGRFAPEEPFFREEGIALFGARPDGPAAALPKILAGFLGRRAPADYCAVLSFLPRTAALNDAARTIRERLGTALGAATMLGFGPRYLHSTGQLYKGGADAGVFLLLTADEGSDLDVPGVPYTFGVLKQAQALGDFQAMHRRGRRILRIHLGRDPERGMTRLLDALGEAASMLEKARVP